MKETELREISERNGRTRQLFTSLLDSSDPFIRTYYGAELQWSFGAIDKLLARIRELEGQNWEIRADRDKKSEYLQACAATLFSEARPRIAELEALQKRQKKAFEEILMPDITEISMRRVASEELAWVKEAK